MTPEYSLIENRFQFRKNADRADLWKSIYADRRQSVLLRGGGKDGEVGAQETELCSAGDSEGHALLIVTDPHA